MKRLLTIPLLFVASTLCRAADVTVMIPHSHSYSLQVVCIVDESYNSRFKQLIDADGFSADHTNLESAGKLIEFVLGDDEHSDCSDNPGIIINITVPNRNDVYVVTILTRPGKGYWDITKVDGHFSKTITVQAPAL